LPSSSKEAKDRFLQKLSTETGYTFEKISRWFVNRRQREKTKAKGKDEDNDNDEADMRILWEAVKKSPRA